MISKKKVLALGIFISLTLSACSSPKTEQAVITIPTPEPIPITDLYTPEPTIEPVATPEPTPEIITGPVTIGFVGDVYLSDTLQDKYSANNDMADILTNGLYDIFQNESIMVANHEYAATDLDDTNMDTRQLYNFKAPKSREILWTYMGVDVVSLANNHALDFGRQSVVDSLDALDAVGIKHIGAGRNLSEAIEPVIYEINGKKIALIASSRFLVDASWFATEKQAGVLSTYEGTPYFNMIKEKIASLKNNEGCDCVIAFVHFGEEKNNQVIDNQKVIAHAYADAGIDVVIGSHAHTLQGIEIYKDTPIYYNLGNFLFSQYGVDTMMVQVTLNEDNSIDTKIFPCTAAGYVAKLCEGDEKERIIRYVESLSINASIDNDGNVSLR